MTEKPDRYNRVAIALHWAIALLILGLLVLGWFLEDLPKGSLRSQLFNLHKSFGLLTLILVLFRVYWRWAHPPPAPVGPPALRKPAEAVHVAIYLLMGLTPLIALIAGSMNRGIDFFALHLDPVFPVNKDLAGFFMHVHGLWAYGLAALVALHAAAALWHQFYLKDGTLDRMSLRRNAAPSDK